MTNRRTIFFVLSMLLLFGCKRGDKLPDLTETYSRKDSRPFGGQIAWRMLQHAYPDQTLEESLDAEDLDLVIRETKRCAGIIRRLLDFAREKVPSSGWFDLNQVLADTVRFVDRPAHLQDIRIVTELDEALPKVWGDVDLIKQVVLNILVNATQAIGENGQIVVRSAQVQAPDAAHPKGPAVPMVEFSIRDNGSGIPEGNLKRIFDPFFTTKEVGKGTGLGLSVSYGIVKAHGGTIQVDSTVGEGSTFTVHLPLQDPSGGASAAPPTAAS